MVVCVHCGQENEEGITYCLGPGCGKRLPAPAAPDPDPTASSQIDLGEPLPAPAPQPTPTGPAERAGRRSGQRRATHRQQGGRHRAKPAEPAAVAAQPSPSAAPAEKPEPRQPEQQTVPTQPGALAQPADPAEPAAATGPTEPAVSAEPAAARGAPARTAKASRGSGKTSTRAVGAVVVPMTVVEANAATPAAAATRTPAAGGPATTVRSADPAEPTEAAEVSGTPARSLVLVGAVVAALLAVGSLVWLTQRPQDEAELEAGPIGAPVAVVTPSGSPSTTDPTPTTAGSGSPSPTAGTASPTQSAPTTAAPSRTPTRSPSAGGGSGQTPGNPDGSSRGSSGPTVFSGRYQIRPAHTGMCLGEGPELFKNTGRTVLGQHSCASARPATALEHVSGDIYRIKLLYGYGARCATVDYGGRSSGLLLAAADCGASRKDQQFRLVAVSSPASGYRMQSVAGGSDLCVGVYDGLTRDGVQIIQDPCRNGRHQIFTFHRA